MSRKLRILFLSLAMICVSFCISADISSYDERIYIDDEELCCEQNGFWIHEGNNVWVRTETVHRDCTGLFTHECSIARFVDNKTPKPDHKKPTYEKSWKCPYCYTYWPIGKSCENASCPSKYK